MHKVMIIDNSASSRKLTTQMLQACNFDLFEASNTKSALEIIKTHFPSIIIMDWNLPVTNGLSFINNLKEQVSPKDFPYILLCATVHTAPYIETGIKAGANSHIKKPFSSDEILQKLASMGINTI